MHQTLLIIFLAAAVAGLPCSAQNQSGAANPAPRPAPSLAPLYRITVESRDPVGGLPPSSRISAPYECTNDGAVFANLVLQPSELSPPVELIVSIAPSGEVHEFRLDQLSELHDVMPKGDYASESEVVLLVRAAPEDKQGKKSFVTSDGVEHEVTGNLAEHHDYLVIFDRKGNYKKRVQIDDSFAVYRVGMFPSGAFLAFGFDHGDHSPKLMMLKEDGTLLKLLDLSKNHAPASMFGTLDGSGKGPAIFVKPVQLMPYGDSIVVVLNQSKFPLLEVNGAGAMRAIKPKLPEGMQINMLIPSDENLYALTNETRDGSIYELNAHDGKVLRRFQVADHGLGVEVACVHDGKFLSFAHSEGNLVPMIGTAEPVASADFR